MSNTSNISSVISPDILKTISSSTAIKTFGDQLKNQAKDKIIQVAVGKTQDLQNQIQEVVTTEIQVRSDHNTEIKRLDKLYRENQITKEQYDESIIKENAAFNLKLEELKILKNKLQTDLNNILSDPYSKIKDNQKKRKELKNQRKAQRKAAKTGAKRDLTKKVMLNAAKTLAPVIALQISNRLSSIISQRAKLEKLVDQVNLYIDQANTPDTTSNASNLRSNTVTLINNSIGKLTNLKQTLNQINTYLAIFNVIVTVLSSIPIPTSVPPGIGIPVSLIIRIVKAIEKANKLISALNVVLSISTISLENEVLKLNELILRLKNVNLDGLDSQQLSDLTSSIYNNTDDFPMYKGFKFKIKEEQNQAFVVKGNKRRYAVAVDRDGVEVLKSEYSFTLDPNDLIDQLKLIIDQRNLQG
jgi:hypothetical protein